MLDELRSGEVARTAPPPQGPMTQHSGSPVQRSGQMALSRRTEPQRPTGQPIFGLAGVNRAEQAGRRWLALLIAVATVINCTVSFVAEAPSLLRSVDLNGLDGAGLHEVIAGDGDGGRFGRSLSVRVQQPWAAYGASASIRAFRFSAAPSNCFLVKRTITGSASLKKLLLSPRYTVASLVPPSTS